MPSTKILSTGSFVPKKVVTNHELAKTVETSHNWIFERTGIETRHLSDPKGGEFPTDMALHAARQALTRAKVDPQDIDLIIFASCTRDEKLPNAATTLQRKLGISNNCGAVDVDAACSGFVYALNFADAMIQSGKNSRILLVGSEMLSAETNWKDRASCILFGDGCGAFLLEASESPQAGVLSTVIHADGTKRDFFYQDLGGTARPLTAENVDSPARFMQMKGREMFKVAVRTLADNALEALEKAKLKLEDIDWLIPHQANLRIIEATAQRLGLPLDKTIISIDKFANTSAASIPLAMDWAIQAGKIKRGDILLLDAFGAGLTSGAAILRY